MRAWPAGPMELQPSCSDFLNLKAKFATWGSLVDSKLNLWTPDNNQGNKSNPTLVILCIYSEMRYELFQDLSVIFASHCWIFVLTPHDDARARSRDWRRLWDAVKSSKKRDFLWQISLSKNTYGVFCVKHLQLNRRMFLKLCHINFNIIDFWMYIMKEHWIVINKTTWDIFCTTLSPSSGRQISSSWWLRHKYSVQMVYWLCFYLYMV